MSKYLFTLFSLFVIVSSVSAQNFIIKGKVLDRTNNTPLIGVTIKLEQTKVSTQTNAAGEFEFANLKSGVYDLIATYIGHKTVTRKIQVPLEGAIEISMIDGTVDLQEVVITGNPLSSDPKDISQSILTISSLDLQNRASNSIGQILNFQPGINMRSNGNAATRPVIRGFSNNRILVLENGLRIGDLSNTSDDHAISSDGSTAEKIEVLRGPASLLYGSNAMGGVINIITEAIPNFIPHKLNGEVSLGYSTTNRELLGSTDLHYGKNNLSFHLNYYNRKSDEYSDGNGVNVFNSDQRTSGYQVGASFIPSYGLAGFSYSEQTNQYGIPTHQKEVFSKNEEGPIKIDLKKKDARFLIESKSINSFINSFSFKGGMQDYAHSEIDRNTNKVGTAFALKSFSGDLSVKHQAIDSVLQGVFGFWGLNQKYSVDGDEAFTPNAEYLSIASYIYEQLKLKNINLQFGVRFELNSIDIPEATISGNKFDPEKKKYNSFSASIGAVYDFSESTSLFANVANAYRSPTIEELSSYAVHGATGTFDIGDRNLTNENNLGIDLGLRVRKTHHSVELSTFFNFLDNYIFRKPTKLFYDSNSKLDKFNLVNGLPVFQYSQSGALVYGFEAKAIYELDTQNSTTVVLDYVAGKERNGKNNLPQIPPFRFTVEQKHTTDDYWLGINLKLAAAQNNVAENENPTKGFGLIDLYAGIKFMIGKFISMATIKIENAFDQPYKEHLSAIKDFAYMPGRIIRLNYKFLF